MNPVDEFLSLQNQLIEDPVRSVGDIQQDIHVAQRLFHPSTSKVDCTARQVIACCYTTRCFVDFR